MEEKQISFVAYEANEARHERIVKRFIIAIIILSILLFAESAFNMWCWYQYDYSGEDTETITTVDGQDGVANYIGNDGDIVNGEDHSSKADTSENSNEKIR